MDPSDKRVFSRTKNHPMEKKLHHNKQGLGLSACSLPGDYSKLVKVRLSDGSIGQACFPLNKKLSDGEKMTSSQARFNSIRDVRMRPAW